MSTSLIKDLASTAFAFGIDAKLYVADLGNNTAYRVDSNGVVSSFATGLEGASPLTVDTNGNFYVGCFRCIPAGNQHSGQNHGARFRQYSG